MAERLAQACTIWLPPLAHFAAGAAVRSSLLRADALPAGAKGFVAGLGGWFPDVPAPLPAAACGSPPIRPGHARTSTAFG